MNQLYQKVFGKNELVGPEVVENVTEESGVSIDENSAFVIDVCLDDTSDYAA